MGMYSDWVARNPGGNDKQIVNIEWVLKMLDKLIPPVGSMYMSTSAANPNSIYPNTSWVAWGSGRVPVSVKSSDTAFNNVEKTGGSKTHTLMVNEMPSHNHSIKKQRGTNKAANGSSVSHGYWEGLNPNNGTISSKSAGSSFSHNNLQPYITCYMFKRTA